MQAITQMLMNNVNQRMTVELINGMNHTIKTEFEKLLVQLQAAEAERDELRKQLEALTPAESKAEDLGGEENKDVA